MVDSEADAKTATYRLDSQIGYLLRLASQRHANIFQHHSVLDLTPTQFAALIRVSEVGECSQNHLGRMTSMDVATIKGVVGRLQRKDLVTLRSDPKDKRRTIIALSNKAAAMIDQLHDIGEDISNETLRPLTNNEKTRLLQILEKIS
ncbi:MAG: MarR family winged helix-turn-helix transcriptional regulator [Rhodobacteraceae bacterium]|nr:MarR family winged helix-turn-helix transcriptional regulator [Paracoccaceae bacterium]